LAQQRKKKGKKEVDRIEATSSTEKLDNPFCPPRPRPPHEIFGNEEPLRSTNRKKNNSFFKKCFWLSFCCFFCFVLQNAHVAAVFLSPFFCGQDNLYKLCEY